MSNVKTWTSCSERSRRSLKRRRTCGRTSTEQPPSMAGRQSLNSDSSSVYTPFLRRFTDEAALDLRETIALYHHVRREHDASPWSHPDIVATMTGKCVQLLRHFETFPEYKPLLN